MKNKSKLKEEEIEAPLRFAVDCFNESKGKGKGLVIMPGTPFSEMRVNEMPSPRGTND